MRSARIALIVWPASLLTLWAVLAVTGFGPQEAVARGLSLLGSGPWALAALLAAYAVRAVLLLPMTVLTVFAGFLLGPVWGAVGAVAGTILSAVLAYAVARWLRHGTRDAGDDRGEVDAAVGGVRNRPWAVRLRSHPFEAVLTARAAAVPGDLVNLVSGAWRIPVAPFALGTVLGGLPGILAAVWAGASLEGAFAFEGMRPRPALLLASGGMLVVSVLLARVVRTVQRRRGDDGR